VDASVAAILLPPMTRFTAAATGVAGTPDVRERLRLAEAGKLAVDDARVLGADLDRLAVLLTPR
jgi:hypothetical protein